ncbi:MAG: undecaprenyl-phosphate glucose phosphotransferase [Anaerolineales bacterium]
MDTRRFRTLFSLSLAVVDAFMLSLAFALAFRLRRDVPIPTEAVEMGSFRDYVPTLVLFVGSVVIVFFLFRLYHLVRASSRVDEFYAVVSGVSVGTLLGLALQYLVLKNGPYEVNLARLLIGYFWASGVLLVTLGRWVLEITRDVLRSRGWVQDRVLILGTGEPAELVLQKIHGSPFLGYRVVGVVGHNGQSAPATLGGVAVIGTADDLPQLIETQAVDEVIIAVPDAPDEELVRLIDLCQRDRLSIKLIPNVYDILASGVTIDDLGGLPLLSVRDVALRGWKLAIKRAMDILGSSAALILFSPVMMLTALLIKLDSRGPVFFVQERMGLDAKPFPVLKFRSMRLDAEEGGPGWTVKDDTRITRLGRFIRRTSLDEFPQFINVLVGEMSLVGPRPEQLAFVEQFRRRIPRYMGRHREKAGTTGWAQVNGLRGDTSIEERTKYDLWYIENWSVWLDIKIIIRTMAKIFFDRSAY